MGRCSPVPFADVSIIPLLQNAETEGMGTSYEELDPSTRLKNLDYGD